MRISDWSSDVCSSDLDRKTIRCNIAAGRASCGFAKNRRPGGRSAQLRLGLQHVFTGDMEGLCTRLAGLARQPKPRHASAGDRKRDGEGKSVSVRVDLRGGRIIKKNKQHKTRNN